MKSRFESDGKLTFEQNVLILPLSKVSYVKVVVKSVFEEDEKYYPQVF